MKTDIKDLRLDFLRSRYMLANTPTFVLREFREDGTVRQYSDAHSPGAIADDAMTIASDWELSANTLTTFYALLVALSFKPYGDIAHLLTRFESIHYEFMPDLLEIIKALMRPSSSFVMNITSPRDHIESSLSLSAYTVGDIIIPPTTKRVII